MSDQTPSTVPGRLPITILTGFTGSGKTTLLVSLLPQLRRSNPNYKLAMIKNEIGDVAVDSALASAAEMTGTQELLGDCICCTNVGQIQDALETLDRTCHPDRVVIETSGSAEPLKLVLEVNRIGKETGRWELDGVVSVIDAENWSGYASKSFTAKLQAEQTDLIVINKWEDLSERAFDLFLDRLGDLDVQTPQVRSDKGWVSPEVLFGLDSKIAANWTEQHHHHVHANGDEHEHNHRSEVECISVTLDSNDENASVDMKKLESLLETAPKDEVYRIKAVLYSITPPEAQNGVIMNGEKSTSRSPYILNWSFGRWTWTGDSSMDAGSPVLRMSIFTAQYESNKWMKRIESGNSIAVFGSTSDPATTKSKLEVKRVQ
jgi:G3E family GTPase